jgi:hypothetical protein
MKYYQAANSIGRWSGWLRRGFDQYLSGNYYRSTRCYLYAAEFGTLRFVFIFILQVYCVLYFLQTLGGDVQRGFLTRYIVANVCGFLLLITSSVGYEVGMSNAAYVMRSKLSLQGASRAFAGASMRLPGLSPIPSPSVPAAASTRSGGDDHAVSDSVDSRVNSPGNEIGAGEEVAGAEVFSTGEAALSQGSVAKEKEALLANTGSDGEDTVISRNKLVLVAWSNSTAKHQQLLGKLYHLIVRFSGGNGNGGGGVRADSLLQLGTCYTLGRCGVGAPDVARGLVYYSKVVAAALADLPLVDSASHRGGSGGDGDTGFLALQEQGALASVYMGAIYHFGMGGVPVNPARAQRYYEQAAQHEAALRGAGKLGAVIQALQYALKMKTSYWHSSALDSGVAYVAQMLWKQ